MAGRPKTRINPNHSRQWDYQLELVAKRRCAQCRKRWIKTKYHCATCAARKARTAQLRNAETMRQGLCVRCKKPRNKYAYNCDDCQAKHTAYAQAWRATRKAKKEAANENN